MDKLYISMINSRAADVHHFYLNVDNQKYYLFTQKAYLGIFNYFRKPRVLNEIQFKKAHEDHRLLQTMEKLPKYIRYIEKEMGLTLLDKTRKKSDRRFNHDKNASQQTEHADLYFSSVEMMDDVR